MKLIGGRFSIVSRPRLSIHASYRLVFLHAFCNLQVSLAPPFPGAQTANLDAPEIKSQRSTCNLGRVAP